MTSIEELSKRVEALELEVKELKTDEIWVPIKDNWNYFISNKGRVKRYDGFEPKISVKKSDGYYQVCLNKKPYRHHRLLAQAFIPNLENKPCVDHIDGNPLNNSLSNLRWCSHAENAYNTGRRRNNTSRFKCVSFNKDIGKYIARISLRNGKRESLGYFDTAEEASAAYEAAAEKQYGEFYRAPE